MENDNNEITLFSKCIKKRSKCVMDLKIAEKLVSMSDWCLIYKATTLTIYKQFPQFDLKDDMLFLRAKVR